MPEGFRILPRSHKTLSHDDFFGLMHIHDENPWLSYENVRGLYELWELADNEEQEELLEFLIGKFSYIDPNILREACKSIAHQVEISWNLSPDHGGEGRAV